jgi:hypothetical protein
MGLAREEQPVDWSLFGCARKGHVTYAPDEPDLRDRLTAPTAGGTAWRCLRCGTFVTHGQPGKGQHRKVQHGSGPAAAAPLLRRGKELRDELILRVFAVERFIRFVIFAAAAHVRGGKQAYEARLRTDSFIEVEQAALASASSAASGPQELAGPAPR